ncbi:MAG TPA: family 20 glycosylhydrolase [Terriglobales bacterium]|nr:family 20 glycosylhydrolase [Terriglobales bacterium]
MPLPASISVSPGRMPIDSTFGVSTPNFSDDRLKGSIVRMLGRLGSRTGLVFSANGQGKLVVDVNSAGMKVQGLEEDESYTLEISPQRAMLKAATVVGAMRGLETFLQLADASSGTFGVPLVNITDRPRFPWRGLLLDVSRHWQPTSAIKRTLDTMSVVKLNVFHWHLSDDQGFRVESLRFPLLHKMGSDSHYYTQAEIREIVAYARDRGIRVLPEFDMPAHANPWFIGYPELGSLPGPSKFIHDYAVTTVNFDPTRESTYRFIDEFLSEMTQLFPDKYWHIGGDEVDGYSWDNNPHIQAFMKHNGLKDNAALQAYFNNRLVKILQKHGRRMVGWDEILRPDIRKDIVVQSWQSSEALGNSAKMGFDGFLSAPYYLDKMKHTSEYYAADPSDSTLTAERARHILGGEVCAWGELLSEENLDSRIWPYSAAIAERFWSPREVTNTEDMYRRLDAVSLDLEAAGSQHISNFEFMMRQASNGADSEAVHEFFGLVEPLRLGAYREQHHITQLTPLVALGDIAIADPPAAQHFKGKLNAFLKGAPQYRDELTREFRSWQGLKPKLDALAQTAPAFRDADGTATDLADLGVAGQEALSFITNRTTAPADWTQRQIVLIDRAKLAKGVLRVAVVDAMQQLFNAATSTSH